MSRGILGRKLGMTGIFLQTGAFVPVTVIEAGPCVVTQIKTTQTDGYNALQLGFGFRKQSRTNSPLSGHLKKCGQGPFAVLKEFAVQKPEQFGLGQSLGADLFKVGEKVDVTGYTKGRGFSGVIKRHGFHRGPITHGGMNVRPPGSIGCSAWPSRVMKGKKMPGQYGNERKTIRNLEVVDVRPEENLILIRGAVPGHKKCFLEINKPKFAK